MSKYFISFLYLHISLFFSSFMSAATILPESFRSVSVEDGLLDSMVIFVFKDFNGFIWLVTSNGLNRFDGEVIKSYPLYGDEITSICQTDSTWLWVGSNNGLKKFNLSTKEFEDISYQGEEIIEIKRICYFGGDNLYIGTLRGLSLLNCKEEKHEKKLLDGNIFSAFNQVLDIHGHSENVVWCLTGGGLIKFDMENEQSISYPFEEKINTIKPASLLSCEGLFYLACYGKGIVTFNEENGSFIPLPEVSGKDVVEIIYEDSLLYIASNRGISIVSPWDDNQIYGRIVHNKNDPYSIKSNSIVSFYKKNNEFWIGTVSAGVNYTNSKSFIFSIYNNNDLDFTTQNKNIRSFWIDEGGEKLIGTREGLFYISEEKKILKTFTVDSDKSLPSNIILFIRPYKGKYLICTFNGVVLFDPLTLSFSSFHEDAVFRKGAFYSFTIDSKGEMWFASSLGVVRYNEATGEIQQYTRYNSQLKNEESITINCDSKDRIWVGTLDGVYLYDPAVQILKGDIFPSELAEAMRVIHQTYEDSKGNIWICTKKDGLIKIDGNLNNYEVYSTQNILPSNVVKSIIEDKYKCLWISTIRGIIYYDPLTQVSQTFSMFDGLPGYLFNNSVQLDCNNNLWWGNEYGLTFCNIDRMLLLKNNHSSLPRLTEVHISGEEITTLRDQKGEYIPLEDLKILNLKHTQNNIGLRFSTLDYIVPKGSYMYILEGYDKEWNTILDNNFIRYNQLPSGNYLLRIKSLGGDMGETKIQIHIRRNPVYFILLSVSVVFCIFLAIYLFYRKRKRISNTNVISKNEKGEKYERIKLKEEEAKVLIESLRNIMENEKKYLNPDLKLNDLSKELACSNVELSQIFSVYMNTSFADFINKYRIEEFKRKILSEDSLRYTLSGLAESCGFSSRSTFYRAFKKITGISPAEYMKKNGITISRENE